MNSARSTVFCVLLTAGLASIVPGLERGDPGYAKFSMALSYSAKGEHEEAAGILAGLKENYPDNETIRLELAKALGYAGNLSEAESLFDSLPRGRETLLAHASVLEASQEFGRAGKKYKSILKESPEDASVMMKLARVLTWKREFEAAGGYYEKILELRPEDTEAMLLLAELNASRGKYDEAVSLCLEILEIEPGNKEAMLYLARFRSWSREYSGSLKIYGMLIDEEPSRALFRREKARVLGWDRRYQQSLEEYRKLIDITGPDRAVEIEMRAKKNYFRQYPLKAEKYYKKWLSEEPDSLEALFDLAQLYSTQERWEKAEAAYSEVLQIMPEHFRAETASEKVKLLSGRVEAEPGAAYYEARSADRNIDVKYYEYFIKAGRYFAENFKLDLSLHETEYTFEEGETRVRSARAEGQLRYSLLPRLQAEAGLAYSRYTQTAESSLSPRGALSLRAADPLRLHLSFAREDILNNYPALADEITKDEYALRAEAFLSRRMRFGADYLRSDYNDDNRENRWGLDLNAAISHEPRSLSVFYRYEAFKFDEGSAYYFSPDSFHTHRASAVWRHHLNEEEMFWGAPEAHYTVSYEIIFDRGGATGHKIAAGFHRDISENSSLGLEASKTFYSPSQTYRENRVGVFLKHYF